MSVSRIRSAGRGHPHPAGHPGCLRVQVPLVPGRARGPARQPRSRGRAAERHEPDVPGQQRPDSLSGHGRDRPGHAVTGQCGPWRGAASRPAARPARAGTWPGGCHGRPAAPNGCAPPGTGNGHARPGTRRPARGSGPSPGSTVGRTRPSSVSSTPSTSNAGVRPGRGHGVTSRPATRGEPVSDQVVVQLGHRDGGVVQPAPSSDRHAPSRPWTLFAITSGCAGSGHRCGCPSDRTLPRPARGSACSARPRVPARVNSARSSRNANASSTASWCACAITARVGWSAIAHSTLTDFGAVKVRSNPATAWRARRPSTTG